MLRTCGTSSWRLRRLLLVPIGNWGGHFGCGSKAAGGCGARAADGTGTRRLTPCRPGISSLPVQTRTSRFWPQWCRQARGTLGCGHAVDKPLIATGCSRIYTRIGSQTFHRIPSIFPITSQSSECSLSNQLWTSKVNSNLVGEADHIHLHLVPYFKISGAILPYPHIFS
jgi:hypothetical protein